MIAALLMLLLVASQGRPSPPVPSIDGLPIGGLARQDLPKTGCAAYLFTTGATRTFAAMVRPGVLRIALDGKPVDLAASAQDGPVLHGLSRDTDYRTADMAARLSMTIVDRPDLMQGAAVTEALLTLDRPGRDAVAVPLAGLVGCAP